MWTGGIEARKYLSGDWDHAVLAEKKLVRFDISPSGIREVADALDEEEKREDRDERYVPGVIVQDKAEGLFVIGKIPAGLAEPQAYTTEPYWGDITLYISTERLRRIANRLRRAPETLIPEGYIKYRRKEIAEIVSSLVVIFRWDLEDSSL